eukprot:gene3038-2020_t
MLVIHLTAFDLHGYVDLINVNATVCLCWVVNFVDFSSAKFNYLCVSLVVIFVDLFVTEWLLMGSLKCICGIIVLIWAFVTVYYCDYSFKVDDVVAGLFAVDLVLALCALCFLSCFPIYVACIAGVLMHYVMLCGFTIDFITGMFVSDANYGLLLHVIFGCFWVLWFMVLCDEFRFLLDTNEIVGTSVAVLDTYMWVSFWALLLGALVTVRQLVGCRLVSFAEVICLCMDGLLIDSVVLLCRPGEFVCLKTYYLPLISSSLLFQVGCGLQWFSIVVSWFYGFYDGMLVFSDLGDRDAIKPFGSILMCVIMLVEYLVTVQRGFVLMVVDLLCLVVSGLLCCDGMGVVRCAVVRPYSLAELCRGFVCLAYHSLGKFSVQAWIVVNTCMWFACVYVGCVNLLLRVTLGCYFCCVSYFGTCASGHFAFYLFVALLIELVWAFYGVFGTVCGHSVCGFSNLSVRTRLIPNLCFIAGCAADVLGFPGGYFYGSYSVWLCIYAGGLSIWALQVSVVVSSWCNVILWVSYMSIYYSFCVGGTSEFHVFGGRTHRFVGFGLLGWRLPPYSCTIRGVFGGGLFGVDGTPKFHILGVALLGCVGLDMFWRWLTALVDVLLKYLIYAVFVVFACVVEFQLNGSEHSLAVLGVFRFWFLDCAFGVLLGGSCNFKFEFGLRSCPLIDCVCGLVCLGMVSGWVLEVVYSCFRFV